MCWIGTVLSIAVVVSLIVDFSWHTAFRLYLPLFWGLYAWAHFRPLHADSDGITRRDTFRATPWSQVDALIEPGRWDATIHIRVSGNDRPTGFPAEHLERLVELSGKPVERRKSSRSPT